MTIEFKIAQIIAQLVVDARLGKTNITNKAISDLIRLISDLKTLQVLEQTKLIESQLNQVTGLVDKLDSKVKLKK